MKPTVNTVWGAKLSNVLHTNAPFIIDQNTTLNEALGINIDHTRNLSTDTKPRIAYFCIGNGGHTFTHTKHGIPVATALQHKSTDAGLYNQIPFVIRRLDDDLAPADRERYALRALTDINGVLYWAYYLRRIDLSLTTARVQLVEIVFNPDRTISKKTIKPYVPNSSNLNPKPDPLSPTGVNTLKASYVETVSDFDISFDANDCKELINVSNILYNQENLGIISEIGLCSGVDRRVEVEHEGQRIHINEALGVQIVCLCNTYQSSYESNEYINMKITFGSELPLYILETP